MWPAEAVILFCGFWFLFILAAASVAEHGWEAIKVWGLVVVAFVFVFGPIVIAAWGVHHHVLD